MTLRSIRSTPSDSFALQNTVLCVLDGRELEVLRVHGEIFYIDYWYYRETGRTLTGARWSPSVRTMYSVDLSDTLDSMSAEGEIECNKTVGNIISSTESYTNVDTDGHLHVDEKRFVDSMIDELSDETSLSVVEWTTETVLYEETPYDDFVNWSKLDRWYDG